MRTSEFFLAAALVAVSAFAGGGTAHAFEGSTSKKDQPSPLQSFQTGARAYMAGDKAGAVTSLLDAAKRGHAVAQWKLGRMYAEGDGVEKDEVKAFDYFSQVANAHADDAPDTMQSRFVANSFVALGNYYLDGIAGTPIKADQSRAREMFSYAASYFGDPDAQYNLARMYLDDKAGKDVRQAARWLGLAANKGQREAQAVLGHMLFNGIDIPKQRPRGLMWLTLAKNAKGSGDKWIGDLYSEADAAASPDDKEKAQEYVSAWNKDRD